jgi:ribosomal-protein-alanine N-acetyltransferase
MSSWTPIGRSVGWEVRVSVRLPLLEGERVIVRLATPEDVPAIVRFFLENAEHFRPTDPPRPPDFYTEAYRAQRIEAARYELQQDRSCQMFVIDRQTGDPLGYVNLSNFVRGVFHACYLGYGIGRAVEGRGMMSEAVRLAVGYAFNVLKLHRIMANYIPENERSGRLLQRLGFTIEGRARAYLFINGRWQDHILTALVNDAWEGSL